MRALDILVNKISNKEKLLMMFDYDGTLTPIVEKPEKAILDNMVKQRIEFFAENNFAQIAIITGRTIHSLLEVSGFISDKLIVYGVHGGQVLQNKEIRDMLSFEEKSLLFDFLTELQKRLLKNKGLLFENKSLSVTMHYRLADEETSKIALNTFIQTAYDMKITDKFRIQEGKKVIELLPKEFNKGNIVKKLIKESKDYFPIYFGDDLNDITAFNEVKNYNGLAFGIGEVNPGIKVYVDDFITLNDLIEKVFLIGK